MTAHDRAPAPPLDEADLQAIEQEIAANLAVARERYPGATDDQVHTAVHHRDALALIDTLRAAWRENARLRAALEHYADEATWKKASRYDTNKRVYVGWWGHPGYDHARTALAAPGGGGEATEEQPT